jgi:sialic acid synthase SpsE
VDLLDSLGAQAFKVGSDDLVYTPFLEYVARKGKPMIISSGMADAADVDRAVFTIQGAGNDRIVVLHCVSLYPTAEDKVNLRKIATLRALQPEVLVGFSDHSSGITACLGAVALGACVLEKHFTLDKNLPGPDHWFSADPEELSGLVREVRRLEANLGSGGMRPSSEERKMASLARRSIVAARDLPAGSVLTEADLAFKRPGTGLMPYEVDKVLGRTTRVALGCGTFIHYSDLEKRGE